MRIRIFFTELAVLLFLFLCPVVRAEQIAVTVDGVKREALVFPASAHPEKAPVLLFFHGHGGSMNSAAKGLAFQNIWPEATIVYPQGLPTVTRIDPKGEKPGWQPRIGDNGDRDLKFFDQMLVLLHKRYGVENRRVYIGGFSNGAFFSYELLEHRPEKIAAIAACAGLVGQPSDPIPAIPEPRPVLDIAGEKDPLVLLSKQKETVEALRRVNGATAEGESCGKGCTRYRSTKGAPVVFVVHPGGHVVPPGAARRMTEFFKNHPE